MGTRKNFVLTISLLTSFVVHAGPPEPSHPITAAEKAFFTKTTGLIQKALPPVPAGWTLKDSYGTEIPETIIDILQTEMLDLDYSWKIEHNELMARHEKYATLAMAGMNKMELDKDGLPKGTKPLMDKNMKLAAQMQEAIKVNDMKKAEKIGKEMEAISKEMDKISKQTQAKGEVPMSERRALFADTSAGIRIEANMDYLTISSDSKEVEAPAGVTFAFRNEREERYEPEVEGETILFVGPWRKEENNTIKFAPTKSKKYTDVQNFIIIIRAQEKRAQSLIQGMKLDALAASVK